MKRLFTCIATLTTLACATVFTGSLCAQAGETPKAGDKAPLFEGKDQDGHTFKLADRIGKQAVLLYFYPKDDTPGCTKQACGLRDRMGDLKKENIEVIGVSRDDSASHQKFIAKHNLNFTLLADTDGKITELYGAQMPDRPMSRRVSFLISKEGRITHVTDDRSADKHLSEMKDAAAKLAGK
jgi:peroxiredoxin Q/BCP